MKPTNWKPCGTCRRIRAVMPKAIRSRLEDLERRRAKVKSDATGQTATSSKHSGKADDSR